MRFEIMGTTNIPSLPTLFDLTFGLDGTSSMVDVGFSSPLMSAPIGASDFTIASPGTFVLPPDKTDFQLTFMVPAGVIAMDPVLGPVGLELNIEQDTAASAGVPEPSSLVLLAAGWLGLGFWRWADAASVGKMSKCHSPSATRRRTDSVADGSWSTRVQSG